MNEEFSAGELCHRILKEFEKAPPDCRQTPDGAALDAYLCPSNQPTLLLGCCFWPDGRAVRMGDTIEPGPEADAMMAFNLQYCEEYVREHVTVQLNQQQFSALCSFRFNTRETTLRNSSRLLPAINAQEWQKAAVAFTEFVYGSSIYDGRVYQEALRGLLRRRLWEALIFLGLDPSEAVKDKDVALPSDRKLLNSGVYRDMIRSEGLTTLNQVKMRATPLILNIPAPTASPSQVGNAERPEIEAKPVAPPKTQTGEGAGAAQTTQPVQPPVPTGAPITSTKVIDPPAPPQTPVVVKRHDPPIPIGQQTSAVDATRNSQDWSAGPKAMIFSRRFWGLFLVLVGRIWMLRTGSNAVLGTVSDPLVMEMFSGFMVMMIGELVQHWGERKATRPLK